MSAVEELVPWVRTVASGVYRRAAARVEYGDLVGEGYVALCRQADRHPDLSAHELERRSILQVRGAMIDHLRRVSRWHGREVDGEWHGHASLEHAPEPVDPLTPEDVAAHREQMARARAVLDRQGRNGGLYWARYVLGARDWELVESAGHSVQSLKARRARTRRHLRRAMCRP